MGAAYDLHAEPDEGAALMGMAYEIPSAALAHHFARRPHAPVRFVAGGYVACETCRSVLNAVEFLTTSCVPVDCRCATLDPDLRPCEPCHRTTTERRL